MEYIRLHLLVQTPADHWPAARVIMFIGHSDTNLSEGPRPLEVTMAEHDEVYDEARADRLAEMLRALAERIRELDRGGHLLGGVPELLRLMGDARSEMFHYEVRVTYDTPEVADSRRIVDEAQRQEPFHPDDPEDEEPWRHRPSE
jgi:hypothetical protein